MKMLQRDDGWRTPTDFARKRNQWFQGRHSFLASKACFRHPAGLQMIWWHQPWQLKTCWSLRWGLWPQQAVLAQGAVEQEFHSNCWKSSCGSQVWARLLLALPSLLAFGIAAFTCLSLPLHCCYFIVIKPNTTVLAFFPCLTQPPVTSSLYICYFCWRCMSLSCLPYKSHQQPWKYQDLQRLPQLQPCYWDTSLSHTVSSIVFPGNYFGHILWCWIRADWAEGRSEHQWHDLTLTVKENSIQVTRTVDGWVPTEWDYVKKSNCDGAVLDGQFTAFQFICVFSPW